MQIDLTPGQQDFVRERRRAEILAAVDAARASIARGEGMEITQESMRALAEEIKQRKQRSRRDIDRHFG